MNPIRQGARAYAYVGRVAQMVLGVLPNTWLGVLRSTEGGGRMSNMGVGMHPSHLAQVRTPSPTCLGSNNVSGPILHL